MIPASEAEASEAASSGIEAAGGRFWLPEVSGRVWH
jgi:hypothetical protein